MAESEKTIVIDTFYYFPPDTVNYEFLEKSNKQTTCYWKGQASYYNIKVDGKENEDAAWCYPEAKDKAKNIENYIAFWRGVEVTE
ncbi:MAG: DUF427 domain-containing protein [Gammaproteobacteria bacterium]